MSQLIDKSTLLSSGVQVAVCGLPITHRKFGDAFHVGIYYNYNGSQKVIHYNNPVFHQDISESTFDRYLFNPVTSFPVTLIPFIHSLSGLVASNRLNNFAFRRVGVPYNGEGFALNSGNFSHTTTTSFPINCGVFVVAFFKSCRFELLNWNSWPTYQLTGNELKTWLTASRIPRNEWIAHHNYLNRNIRGKDIIAAPSTSSLPAIESEAVTIGNYFIWLIFGRYPV